MAELLRVRNKPVPPPILIACQWDESQKTLDLLRKIGLRWVGNEGHRDNPDLCRYMRVIINRQTVYANPGDWLVKTEDGTFIVLSDSEFRERYEFID